jgi:arabinogalactan oligomer/maltooligosaccharide transport system substrate-binding protein
MKRAVALLAAMLMLAGAAAGCASAPAPATQPTPSPAAQTEGSVAATNTPEPVNITIWYESDNTTLIDGIQKELDKLAPAVAAKMVRKDKMTEALKLVGDDPNSAPDMYLFAHDKIGVYAQMGILAPITDFISMDGLADMIPMTVSAATYKGQVYQLPIYFETLLFMYNKALMKEVPKTTDDLLAYMRANTKDGNYAFVEQHSTAYYAVGWIHAFGGYVINGDAQPGLNLPETVRAVAYHKQFVSYMPIDGDYNTMTTLFKEGKAQSTIGGPWLIPDVKAAGIDLGLAPLPTVNETGRPISPFSGVQGVCVLKTAEAKKDAVAAVLKQLALPDIGIALAISSGCAPANQKCYNDSGVAADPIIMAMKTTAENAVPMPNVPEMDVMWAVTENLLVAVNKNNGDPQTECDKAQADALEQIAAMK